MRKNNNYYLPPCTEMTLQCRYCPQHLNKANKNKQALLLFHFACFCLCFVTLAFSFLSVSTSWLSPFIPLFVCHGFVSKCLMFFYYFVFFIALISVSCKFFFCFRISHPTSQSLAVRWCKRISDTQTVEVGVYVCRRNRTLVMDVKFGGLTS